MFVILDGTASVEWRGGSVDLEAGTFFGELTLLAPGGTPERSRTRCDRDALSRDPARRSRST